MSEPTLPEKHVVTAFIRNAGRILLVRRSQHVGSYQGRWSAISGYLDNPDPLCQALTEIREEISLDENQLELIRQGTPLPIPDHHMGVCWVVHPFLFDTTEPEAVRLDWENIEFRWLEPAKITSMATVPGLLLAWQRCQEPTEATHD